MKTFKILFVILVISLNIKTFSQTLSYTPCMNGMGWPEFDGGRSEFEFADINGDGHVDILSIGDHGSPFVNTGQHGIMVWFGDGTGQWTTHQEGDFGYGGIAVGDVNNDGIPDVGYGMHHNYSGDDFGDQLIEVALGDGTGMSWTPWDDGLAANGEDWGMFGTDFGDVNNDGWLDIGSVSFGAGAGVHVYLNNHDGTWQQSFGFLGGNSTMIFHFGYINNDWYLDMVVTQEQGTVYFGDGAGDFELHEENLPPAGGLGRTGISLGDINNDGGDDLAMVNDEGGVEVWTWNDQTLEWDNASGSLPQTGDHEATQLFDMNVDGYVDLVTFEEGTITVWLGDGTGNWTQDAQFAAEPNSDFKAFRVGGDIDHNGYPDMVFLQEEGSWPSYQNHLYCYCEESLPQELTVTAMWPRGNENLLAETAVFIDWISAVPENQASEVMLEFSESGPDGPFTLINQGIPNNGRYQWTVPVVFSDQCYIKYTVSTSGETATCITPAAFSVTGEVGSHDVTSQKNELYISAYPNPFAGKVNIELLHSQNEPVKITVCNSSGKQVDELFNGELTGESFVFSWENKNAAPGVYFLLVRAGNKTYSRKLIHTGTN